MAWTEDENEQAAEEDQQSGEKGRVPDSEDDLNEMDKLAKARRAAENNEYRRTLERLGRDTQMLLQQAEEEEFVREMRDVYRKDPVEATNRMIRRVQEGTWSALEARIGEAMQQEQEFGRLMDEFFDNPQNSGLRTYRNELEFLIREKGLFPHEAADLIRTIRGKQDQSTKQRSAAASDIRKRSTVETAGEAGEPLDRDREFARAMKKAKTLEQMFAELRKIKY